MPRDFKKRPTVNGVDVLLTGEGGGGAADLPDLGDVNDAIAPAAGDYLRHDGTDWKDSPIQEGDIPAAIARDAEVAAAYQALSVYDAAGDLLYGSGADASTRLALGTAGQVLKVNSGATAPEWGAGGMTLIAETVLGSAAASITFSSIPATYRHLIIELSGRSDTATTGVENLFMRFNGDSSAIYDWQEHRAEGGTPGSVRVGDDTSHRIGRLVRDSNTAGYVTKVSIRIPSYRDTTFFKGFEGVHGSMFNGSSTVSVHTGNWRSTAAITSITIQATGNFLTGSVASLYGLV